MTNHFIDFINTDVFMMIGSNSAENHPQAMKWIVKAKDKGAKLIVVDPRLTKSAGLADVHVRLRPGTDIAFINGMVNYIIENNLYFKDYVLHYTNASFLVNPEYKFEDGVFSGLTEKDGKKTYDTKTWQYQMDGDPAKDGIREEAIKKDLTLQDPNCVFQILKKHVSRYDLKTVSSITGTPKETLKKVYDLFASTGKPDKAGNVIYAMGITQHTYGSQNCRALAVLQLLLGNIGIAGGGVNAQRGESNVQGSTDFAMLNHYLPGYNPMIYAYKHSKLQDYLDKDVPKTSYWSNRGKFLISMLKAWYGDKATKENDFCFDWIPKHDNKNRSHMGIFSDMAEGKIKGMIAWGQNPAVGGPSSFQGRKAMEKLEWLVAVDLFETETAAFWHRPEADPSKIKTEVFFLPAAMSYEKEGTVTNSGRWLQFRYKAVDPPGEAKSDLWIADRLFKAVKKEYQSGGKFPDPILNMVWNYDKPGEEEPNIDQVAIEINGYNVTTKEVLPGFAQLKDDGSTACGCWIHSGYWAMDKEAGTVAAKRKLLKDKSGLGLFPQFAFAWPANRRIVYNRCSADPAGNPWNPKKALVKWDAVAGKWVTADVPDFKAADPPKDPKDPNAKPTPVPPDKTVPFFMQEEGRGRLFAVKGVNDGPLPEHYEPIESPVKNILSKQQNMPLATRFKGDFSKLAETASEKYPYVGTTHRVIEHYQSGAVTRNCPTLAEISAHMFANISPTLAQKIGVKTGDDVVIETVRGQITCKVSVSGVCVPLIVDGKEVEVIGMPWCFGYQGIAKGASANDLTPSVGDPNTNIPEYKAFLCNIKKAGKH
ncbi:formate dehydrogenase major subunit [Desulforamulus putei DSM 12395]|uniref:Formate dehydrogenase major subunit n=3 Tax=Desulforamulus putei TaxID=74701 RepID=A0A1M5AGJ3_9FIRM|nr:formate dehydrogenase major subunit [Desulforamulus putei DSM 12395]